jgi:hypothetical protein
MAHGNGTRYAVCHPALSRVSRKRTGLTQGDLIQPWGSCLVCRGGGGAGDCHVRARVVATATSGLVGGRQVRSDHHRGLWPLDSAICRARAVCVEYCPQEGGLRKAKGGGLKRGDEPQRLLRRPAPACLPGMANGAPVPEHGAAKTKFFWFKHRLSKHRNFVRIIRIRCRPKPQDEQL